MQFDVPSLIFAFAALAVATVAGLARLRVNGESIAAVKLWIRGYGLLAAGCTLIAFQAVYDDSWLVSLGQSITFVGSLHIPAAIAVLRRIEFDHRWLYGAALIFWVTATHVISVSPDQDAELFVICSGYIVMSFFSVYALLAEPGKDGGADRVAEYTMASFLVLFVVILSVAIITRVVAFPVSINDIIMLAVPLMAIIVGAGLTAGFHWMVHAEIGVYLQNLNVQLVEKNERLGQFTSMISHDLKSPLFGVSGNLELVLTDQNIAEGSRQRLQGAYTSASRMQHMIEGLRDWAWVDSQSVGGDFAETRHCISRALNVIEVDLKLKDAEIDLAEKLPAVKCNPELVSQLFQNLFSNAIKYTRNNEPPLVRVDARKINGMWQFRVEDNGRGIPAEQLIEVFQMFKRGGNVEAEEGTGIGLALCKAIVEKHNGNIWCESQLGRGTAMCFTLPATE